MKYQIRSFGIVLIITTLCFGCIGSTKTRNSDDESIEATEKNTYHYKGEALRVGVIGLTHDHVHWILGREDFGDIDMVGIVEPNRELAKRYSQRYGYSMDIVFDTMEEMTEAIQPEAVMAFNDIYSHLKVVEFFAPKGIHIMVEKPLAVNTEHADKMMSLAKKHQVYLLTNYETTWYDSNYEAYRLIHTDKKIGGIRKIVFNTGHPGPVEIGCSKEFLTWLTDPVLNGGGALTDFGCYGANLSTWLMKGKNPTTVTCVTQQIKPEVYPEVDDNATLILTYPHSEVIIQASWNWSHNRKDMSVYGKQGYVICENGMDMHIMESEKEGAKATKAKPLPKGMHDPFAYFTKVVKEHHPIKPYELSSMENNRMVVQILEAAKHSAKTGKTIVWKKFYTTE